jgi:tetratricopeptide (TPR) repeat protein
MLAADNKSTIFQDFVAASEASRLKGDYLEGVQWARRAIDHANVNGEPSQEAEALRLLANQLLRTGEMEEAAEACGRAASLEETTGNETGLSQSGAAGGSAAGAGHQPRDRPAPARPQPVVLGL